MKNKTPLIIGAAIIVVLFIYFRGKKTSSSGTSTVNATNSPMFTVTSMGHSVAQNILPNQVSPQEPGTAPLLNSGQYG